MSEKDQKLFITLRNQILGVIITASLAGLYSMFVFMTTINSRLDNVEKTIDKHDTQIQTLIFRK